MTGIVGNEPAQQVFALFFIIWGVWVAVQMLLSAIGFPEFGKQIVSGLAIFAALAWVAP